MPRFDYRCDTCERTDVDVWVAVHLTDMPRECHVCDEMMTKLPAAPAFVLKGKGFHSVDYPKAKS